MVVKPVGDAYWNYFCAQEIYHSLLSQGKYCPEEKLHIAKLNVDLAEKQLSGLQARRDRNRKIFDAAIVLIIIALIYAVW